MVVITISHVGTECDGTRIVTGNFNTYTRVIDGIDGQFIKLRVLLNYADGGCQHGARCIVESDGSTRAILQHPVVSPSAVYAARLSICLPIVRDVSSVQLVVGLYENKWSKKPIKLIYGNKFIYRPKLEK